MKWGREGSIDVKVALSYPLPRYYCWAATFAANPLQWASDSTGSERHHAQRLVSHMIAKPWSHKQKDRHAASL